MKAVYDLTIGYPDLLPQSEMDVVRGVFPKNVHFHIKRQVLTNIVINRYLYCIFYEHYFWLSYCILAPKLYTGKLTKVL